MDFSKLLKDTAPEMGSNLTIKIGNPPSLTVRKCFCMWSDLLGFGSLFEETNWNLDVEQCRKIYDRLETAHSAVLYYTALRKKEILF